MRRSSHYTSRLHFFQDFKGVAPLSILALLGLTCGILQPLEYIVLGYIFNFWAARERIPIEALTEVCGQIVLVG